MINLKNKTKNQHFWSLLLTKKTLPKIMILKPLRKKHSAGFIFPLEMHSFGDKNWLTLYVAHQARFLAISNMMFHHNLSTIFGGWVPRTIMAYRHMNFCGFQNHCEPDLRISSHIPYLIALYYYCRDSEYLTMKHATYILPRKFGWTFLKHLNEFDPLFYSTITYVY